MEISVIAIGNSRGIRLPKTLLNKYNIGDLVDLQIEKDCIILKPIKKARNGWAEKFKNMNENKDDELLVADVFEDENLEAWN